MKYPGTVAIVIFLTAIVSFIWLMSTTFSLDVPNEEKNATQYHDEYTDAHNDRIALNINTDILGQAVFSSANEVVGTLYDAYMHPQTGKIGWVSINIDGDLEKPLVLLEAEQLTAFGEQEPPTLGVSKAAFLEYGTQDRHEKVLTGFISLRNTPGTMIENESREYRGRIKQVTYKDGAIDTVIFDLLYAPELNDSIETFTIPFEGVMFEHTDGFYNGDILAKLTPVQVEAIALFLKNK